MPPHATDDWKIFVVIPAYNEAARIASTLTPFLESPYNVVVVDDCSSDKTAAVVETLPGIVLLKHKENQGQGAALQTGMDYALASDADFVVHFDADGQHPFSAIREAIDVLLENRADVVLGTRFKRKEDIKAVPPVRRFVLRASIVFNGLMTGVWLSDSHNGFRVLNRKALQSIRFTQKRMAHATEILSLIKKNKLKIVEIPIHVKYTKHESFKGLLKRIWEILRDLAGFRRK